MATKAKIYTVTKDGEVIDKLKSLTAAKKLADDEEAEVYTDGKCVYSGVISAAVSQAEAQEEAKNKHQKSSRFRLKALMNVRERQSLNSRVIATQPEGTIVTVSGIEGDWLRLQDGEYILYEHGRWAEEVG